MKTITLQGTQEQFENLYKHISIEDKDHELIPQEVEIRVYVIDTSYAIPIKDKDFMNLAEEQGIIYSLGGFQKAFNEESINPSHYIRFISVPI